jgi:plasmid stabilization system protein ParE
MRVVYSEEALENLDGILGYISSHYPTVYGPFRIRLQSVVARIRDWPESAPEVLGRPGVRVVPLIRYPYRIFYRATGNTIEILHIHHAAQDQPPIA